MSINRAALDGHLGADPTIRTAQSGKKIATFRLATTEKWTSKTTGEKQEATQWHNIVVFSDWLVDVVEKKLRKGSRVYVEGPMETRDWEKDGIKRYVTEIVVRGGGSIILPIDMPRGDRNGAPPAEDSRTSTRPTSDDPRTMQGRSSSPPAGLDDDVPF